MRYSLFVPKQAVGADLVYFDLFNALSANIVLLESVMPVVSGAVAVTGVLGVDLFLTRTTAVGTGGTAATAEGTSLTAPTFSCLDGSQPLSLQFMSARLTPSGGATAGAVIEWSSVFTEETSSAPYNNYANMVGPTPILIPASQGIRVVQGTVASVGNIGFNVVVNLIPR